METLHTDQIGESYWRRDMPTSPGRLLLIPALGRLCERLHGHDLPLVALTFDEEGSIFVDEPARSQIVRAARRLGEAFAADEVRTYGRAFGGSPPVSLPANAWELDDFDRRFATSALDPSRPFDAAAVATHWIFVDEEGLERLIAAELAAPGRRDVTDRLAGDATADESGPAETQPDRYVRMPELQSRTGLSRATIYRRIESGRFPGKVPMDGNVSVWRESEVAEWLANPR